MKHDPDVIRALVECSIYYQRELSEQVLDVYLEDLNGISAAALRQALKSHRADPDRGRFWPLVADIRAKLPNAHQHPSADIAWSIALKAMDEGSTLVLTDEILQAKSVAQPVWDTGDQIGARMTFKAAYERLVIGAGMNPPRWQLSVGHRIDERKEAVKTAMEQGLISERIARQLAPALPPVSPTMRLLAGNVVQGQFGGQAHGSAAARRLREIVEEAQASASARKVEEQEQRQAREKARREELQRQYEELMDAATDVPLPDAAEAAQGRSQGGTR